MPIFLDMASRWGAALNKFDVLKSEPLFYLLDPIPSKRRLAASEGKPSFWRSTAFVVFLGAGVLIFNLLPGVLTGGNFNGRGGLLSDIGLPGTFIFLFLAPPLVLTTRRILGALILELEVSQSLPGHVVFDPTKVQRGRILRALEWLSRLGWPRFLFWISVMVLINLWGYRGYLLDGHTHWTSSPATPGTIFHALAAGGEQPNLAGIWIFLSVNVIAGYLLLPAIRIFVVFACLCAYLGQSQKLRIVPPHPDQTGGLLDVGQTALSLSVLTFLVGIQLAFMTLSTVLSRVGVKDVVDASIVCNPLVLFWILYLILGPMLFFLPLIPLRIAMAKAKRDYLMKANRLFSLAEADHRAQLASNSFRPEALQGLQALGGLIDAAHSMAVWPFDHKTLLRFVGTLLGPLVPVIYERWPVILEILKEYTKSR
jgi:hypothetical protein